MLIPLRYNLRSLMARWVRTLLTALGIGVVVATFVVIQATTRGLRETIATTGSARNILITDRGAPNIELSSLTWQVVNQVRSLPGVARSEAGDLVSPEYNLSTWVGRAGVEDAEVTPTVVRGIRPVALQVHDQVTLAAGRLPQNMGEVALGRMAASELGTSLGDQVAFGDRNWQVVGLLSAPGTTFEAEVWADLDALMLHYSRTTVTSAAVRVQPGIDVEATSNRWSTDRRFRVDAIPEVNYYAALSQQANALVWLGLAVATVMGVGALVGGMNTMYTAVAGRTREIGILRALGFSARDVQLAFVVESLLIALGGGLLGCLLSFAADGLSFKALGTAFEIQVDAGALGAGLALAALSGVLGGFLPARTGARLVIVEAIRHI